MTFKDKAKLKDKIVISHNHCNWVISTMFYNFPSRKQVFIKTIANTQEYVQIIFLLSYFYPAQLYGTSFATPFNLK